MGIGSSGRSGTYHGSAKRPPLEVQGCHCEWENKNGGECQPDTLAILKSMGVSPEITSPTELSSKKGQKAFTSRLGRARRGPRRGGTALRLYGSCGSQRRQGAMPTGAPVGGWARFLGGTSLPRRSACRSGRMRQPRSAECSVASSRGSAVAARLGGAARDELLQRPDHLSRYARTRRARTEDGGILPRTWGAVKTCGSWRESSVLQRESLRALRGGSPFGRRLRAVLGPAQRRAQTCKRTRSIATARARARGYREWRNSRKSEIPEARSTYWGVAPSSTLTVPEMVRFNLFSGSRPCFWLALLPSTSRRSLAVQRGVEARPQ